MKSEDVDPVHAAVMTRHLGDLTRAIAQGGRVDALDRAGRTPLFYAVDEGDRAIVAELLRLGADVNARDKNLETPLHFAARADQGEIGKLLLENGATVDAQDAHGNTPLFRAMFDSKGRGQMIELLLSFGADKASKNKYGVSPEELAKSIADDGVSP